MPSWFEGWFNSKYYHLLYANRDDREANEFISRLIKELKLTKSDRILDLACGKGRHSRFLNELGFKVVGVDLSADSIESARSFENQTLSFVVHDMRDTLDHGKFNLILNLFTSFGYFENNSENLKVLNAVHGYLNDNGSFVIDFFNSKKVEAELVTSELKKCDEIEFSIQRKIEDGFIYKNIEFTDQNQKYTFQERVQLLSLDDFKELFELSNFKISNVFGNYNLGKFDPKNSERLIMILQKK